ncbi:hypothetical protein EDC02_3533 [Micromonospora sp. Llam0]|uniref:hypothetical protein n=1 Tax=Micromonospora sp. Llam0 TaxID=2485143 RepID=UPI000FB5E0D2|nr:hypothetical protein [Micromonospora sp. Llam0]ROO61588.1 hypothetical protein EDC02_3533 [Micromonospora sp. Llam0]
MRTHLSMGWRQIDRIASIGIVALVGLGVALIGAPATAAPVRVEVDAALAASAAKSPEAMAAALAWTTTVLPDGTTIVARAVSPEEIVARGIAKPGTNILVIPPKFVDNPGAAPVKRPASDRVSPAAVVCWDMYYWFGANPDGTYLDLYTRQNVFYCADNTWISSTSTQCSQFDGGYPTYEAMGCSDTQSYGVGWSEWHVRTTGVHCPYWNIVWGSCLSTDTMVRKLSWNGYGQYTVIESI